LTQYELRRNGVRLPLARLPLDLLIILVQRPGELVTREELAALLWHEKATMIDTQAGLNNAVNRLRSLLNDNAQHPKYIETIIGKGYRFVAASLTQEVSSPVVEAPGVDDPVGEGPAAQTLPENLSLSQPLSKNPAFQNFRKARFAAAVIAAPLLFAIVSWRFVSGTKGDGQRFRAEQVTTNDGGNRVNVAAISPAGQAVVYADSAGFFARDLRDGVVRVLKLPDDLHAETITWSPDDSVVFFGGFRNSEAQWQIWSFRLLTGTIRRIVVDGRHPAISPNGEYIAFTGEKESDIQVSKVDGESRRRLAGKEKNVRVVSLAWSNDSHHIFSLEEARNRGLDPVETPETEHHYSKRWVSRTFPEGRETAGGPADQFDSLASSSESKLYLLSGHVSKDGVQGLGVWWVETSPRTGGFVSRPTLIVPCAQSTPTSLSVSRDGARIAAVLEKGEADVYLADGQISPLRNRRRLTLDSRRDFPNAWMPDSQAVLFESDRSGRFHLYRQRIDTANPELLTDLAGEQISSITTPDGRWILFRQMSGDRVKVWNGLYRIPIEGGAPIKIPTEKESTEVRCPKAGALCVTRTVFPDRLIRFSTLDPLTGVETPAAEIPWTPVVAGDWALAPDRSVVALPGHSLDNPEIRIVSLNRSAPARVLAVKSPGQLWGLHWANTGFGWLAEIRIRDAHLLTHIDSDGRVTELYRTAYNTWALPSPDGSKLAYLDYTTDRNVWVWKH
jgi:Tol biopolymer transport system component/DNA-binding winged helix-turn-helix (wHTH) protein